MAEHGLRFGDPEIDLAGAALLEAIRGRQADWRIGRRWPASARSRSYTAWPGSPGLSSLQVAEREITFENCIIAVGSQAASLPFLPEDPRVIDSTSALSPSEIPGRLLMIGGGIIGLEMATVYDALGARVTVVELLDQLIPGCDPDLVKPLQKRIAGRYEAIHVGVEVAPVMAGADGLTVSLSNGSAAVFDQVLVAVGPQAERWCDRRRRSRRHRGIQWVHQRRPPDADERALDLCHRRCRPRADAGPQGDSRGPYRRRGHRRGAGRGVRRADDPLRRLHRPRGGVDGADRGRRSGSAGGV